MEMTGVERLAFDASKKRDSPASCTQHDDSKTGARNAPGLRLLARRPYVKTAFEHQVVFKRLLLKPDGRATIDQ